MGSSKHVVLFPFMALGHTIPLVNLSKMFALRGFKATIVTTPANSHLILQALSENPKTHKKILLKELQFPIVHDLPKGCESTDQLPAWDLYVPFLQATKKLQQPFEDFLQELANSGDKPNFIISDFLLGWTLNSATKLDIPRLVFHGMGAFSMSVCKSLCVHAPHMHVASETEPFQVPGMPKSLYLTRADLTPPILDLNPDDPYFQFIVEVGESELKSWGVIVNTFFELESDYVNLLESFYPNGARAWCVGPVSLWNELEKEKIERGKVATEMQASASIAWLNQQKTTGSLIYVSFGTQAQISDAQLDEIAFGLEESGVGFVWVVRSNSWSAPDGFEERVKGRAFVLREWAPQVQLLSHPATGGFLSHCGWNSVMESVSAGVPILGWPMIAEQAMNASFVVEELKAGLRLPGTGGSKFVEREAISQGVRELIVGEKGKKARDRARVLAMAAKKAIEEDGSSHRALDSVVDQLCQPLYF